MSRRRRLRTRAARVVALAGCMLILLSGGFTSASAGSARWVTDRVRFEPVDDALLTVAGLGTFRGAIEVRRGPTGVAVINDVGLEDYVRGIDEVPANWPRAALEAQAIAARTYAAHAIFGPRSPGMRDVDADICATEACQVYRGVAGERSGTSPGWVAAVDATAGRVVLYRGTPILAKYASSNGGRSDAGNAPYLRPVDDPDDRAASPWAQWRSVIPLSQISRVLPGPGQLVELNRAGDVVVARRMQPDGTIVDQGYNPVEIRNVFNGDLPAPSGVPVAVPSSRFVAHSEADTAVLEGSGYGHLTGMSQYGALGKARRGLKADDILAAYYSGLRSQALPPDRLPTRIRVALTLGQPSATVSSTGRFRVIAGDGGTIAKLAGDSWIASPGRGRGVEVTSSPEETALPRLDLDAPNASTLGLNLSVPANIVLRTTPGEVADLGVLDAGRHDIKLVGPPPGRSIEIQAEADAGGGRVTRSAITITAPALPAHANSRDPERLNKPLLLSKFGNGSRSSGDGPATTDHRPAAIAATAIALIGYGALRAGKRHIPKRGA